MNIIPHTEELSVTETAANDIKPDETVLDRLCELENQNKELLARIDRNTFAIAFVSILSAVCAVINVVSVLLALK